MGSRVGVEIGVVGFVWSGGQWFNEGALRWEAWMFAIGQLGEEN